jgi:hypothetical protein
MRPLNHAEKPSESVHFPESKNTSSLMIVHDLEKSRGTGRGMHSWLRFSGS